jgi:predicted transcriptional regulator
MRNSAKTRTKPKLSDLQLVLLSAAAARDDAMILPPPESVRAKGKTLTRSLARLLDLGLVAEVETLNPDQAWREEENGRRIALILTHAGRAAIGVEHPGEARKDAAEDEVAAATAATAPEEPMAPVNPASFSPGVRPGTKKAKLVDLVSRPRGGSIDELADMLNWKPHTIRAALTGLRKKGYAVSLSKGDDGRRAYRASPPAPTPATENGS